MHNNLLVTSSPHIKTAETTQKIMLKVIAALVPAIVAATLIFGTRALLVIGVTTAACVGFEYSYNYIFKRNQEISDFSAVVTGILLAFNLPSTIPLWMAIVGAFVSIVIVKMMFGGLGKNFANPAIVGRIVLAMSFTSAMTSYKIPFSLEGADGVVSATPLVAYKTQSIPYIDLFLGTTGGVLGETCAVALILGGIYLVYTKVISPVIPLSYIITVAAISLAVGQDIRLQLFGGGLMLGAIFMATDYVTSPFTIQGKIVYGLGLGIITCFIRFYGNMAEGVSFAILFMNILVPFINDLSHQKALGGKK